MTEPRRLWQIRPRCVEDDWGDYGDKLRHGFVWDLLLDDDPDESENVLILDRVGPFCLPVTLPVIHAFYSETLGGGRALALTTTAIDEAQDAGIRLEACCEVTIAAYRLDAYDGHHDGTDEGLDTLVGADAIHEPDLMFEHLERDEELGREMEPMVVVGDPRAPKFTTDLDLGCVPDPDLGFTRAVATDRGRAWLESVCPWLEFLPREDGT